MPDVRTLVLCVDRDDDIGTKAGIHNTVLGRAACLDAATKLALADPEDSDTNAIFQAIKTFDELSSTEENVFIAVVGGSDTSEIEGDRRIAREISRIVWEYEINECIVVTDGAEDEFVMPLIQASVDVKSVKRVIVKQMPNLESTYYIIKKFLDDPQISKIFLVPIGLAMLLYAFACLFGYPDIAVVIVVGVLGLYLLFKGLGIDEYFNYAITGLHKSFVGGKFSFVAYISAVILGIIGIIIGLTTLLEWYSAEQGVIFYIASFLLGSIAYFTAAILIAGAGKIIDSYLNDIPSLSRSVAVPFFGGSLGLAVYGAALYIVAVSSSLEFPILGLDGARFLIFAIAGALVIASIGMYLQKYVQKWAENRTEDKQSKADKLKRKY